MCAFEPVVRVSRGRGERPTLKREHGADTVPNGLLADRAADLKICEPLHEPHRSFKNVSARF